MLAHITDCAAAARRLRLWRLRSGHWVQRTFICTGFSYLAAERNSENLLEEKVVEVNHLFDGW